MILLRPQYGIREAKNLLAKKGKLTLFAENGIPLVTECYSTKKPQNNSQNK